MTTRPRNDDELRKWTEARQQPSTRVYESKFQMTTTRIDGPGLDKMTLKIADATGLLEAMATTPVTDDSHEWIDKDQVWCGLCLMHVHPEHEHRCHSTPSASTK